jgi:hypothetical protein
MDRDDPDRVFCLDWRPADGIGPRIACGLSDMFTHWLTALQHRHGPCSDDCACGDFEFAIMSEAGASEPVPAAGHGAPVAVAAPTPHALGEAVGLLAQLTAAVLSGKHHSSGLSALTDCFEG